MNFLHTIEHTGQPVERRLTSEASEEFLSGYRPEMYRAAQHLKAGVVRMFPGRFVTQAAVPEHTASHQAQVVDSVEAVQPAMQQFPAETVVLDGPSERRLNEARSNIVRLFSNQQEPEVPQDAQEAA